MHYIWSQNEKARDLLTRGDRLRLVIPRLNEKVTSLQNYMCC